VRAANAKKRVFCEKPLSLTRADAAQGRAPFPVPQVQMLDNIAALEAIFRSARTGNVENV